MVLMVINGVKNFGMRNADCGLFGLAVLPEALKML